MAEKCDILVTGTGLFAERIVFDIAVTAANPVTVAIGGRNRERMDWLKLAANARAAMFGRPARFTTVPILWDSPETIAESLAGRDPAVTVQAASVQSPSVIHKKDSEWGKLVMDVGLSITAVFQILLSARAARALTMSGNDGAFINCCYPDVANGILAGMNLPITCGSGNVAILATMFEGDLGIREPGRVKVLAHYKCLGPWRGPAEERKGPTPRVWIDGEEVFDIYERFPHLQLLRKPVIDISGCSTVPILFALAGHGDYAGHAPGPHGLTGGYPVAVRGRALDLDLPTGLGRDEAIAWNRAFEEEDGILIETDGRLVYRGKVRDALARHSPSLAEGFHVADLEAVHDEMVELRQRLGG